MLFRSSKLIAAHHAVYIGERETFEETLRRLSYDRILPKEVADVFHHLRKLGNVAAHEVKGTHADALSGLKFARQLGVWFHRTYAKQPGFKPGPLRVLWLYRWPIFLADEDRQGDWSWDFGASAAGVKSMSRTG